MPSTFLSNHSTNWTSTQKAFVPITWVRLSISSNWFYHHPSHEWLHVIIVSSMLVLVMYLFTKGKKGLFYRNGGDWPIRLIHQSTHRLSIHPWVRASCQFTHSLHDLNHESSYFNNYAFIKPLFSKCLATYFSVCSFLSILCCPVVNILDQRNSYIYISEPVLHSL